ncbi:MAG: Rrf2 family transcriptional regulator [Eubacteriales bacterium]|nr:Rrf2 family transcriptional regulator [Eubacteriales bacterium]MDD4475444.1 Rrf2 family transcriptional regulator [Eubacteriales bacterium]
MKFSTKGRYALRLMLDLAANDKGNYITLKEISQRQEISMKYLEQIIASLIKDDFLQSTRGAYGGYRLTRSPSDYTVGEILRATEGCLAPVICLEDEDIDCAHKKNGCATRELWQGLYDVMNEYLDNYTLKMLLDKQITIDK